MTIDERLEAVTMNLELTARDVADLQKAVAAMQQSTEEFKRTTAARIEHWEMEKQHLDEKVDSLATSTQMLLTAVQAQQVRIERIERR